SRNGPQQPLPDYLGYSIFTMLCCCLPLGIAALIYSINVSRIPMFLLSKEHGLVGLLNVIALYILTSEQNKILNLKTQNF
uniref:Uncharacterized protein n=1 Tax=Astyanax mexicanus TaxID=7994 RepID=A0A8B9KRJ1_ASTMX